MPKDIHLTAADIRSLRAENPKQRIRDFATSHGLSEAAVLDAHIGQGVTPITADLTATLAQVPRFGQVMALTRNEHVVSEVHGVYGEYRAGERAGMILNRPIDMRYFPRHFVRGYAVERHTDDGPRHSLQFFDVAGDAMHKVHLTAASNASVWGEVVETLRADPPSLDYEPRRTIEPAKVNFDKTERLREQWAAMTDTHQFLGLVDRLKMNRLGAYRVAGAPFVRQLDPGAVMTALEQAAAQQVPVMTFVGNHGCIQIHTGAPQNIKVMGPWFNVLDQGFNLHLRTDPIAEVYAVEKPTRRGAAVSVEAFDAMGGLILQIFGVRTRDEDFYDGWSRIVSDLPTAAEGL